MRGKGSNLLFCHFGGATLTRYHFSAVFDKALHLLDLGGKKYRSHSFRIGAASVGSELGLSVDEVRDLGRWKSRAYKHYIRIPTTLLADTTINQVMVLVPYLEACPAIFFRKLHIKIKVKQMNK